ncbi:MAG: Smr/MutS family protein [Chitinophagales bacterium]
MHFFPINTPEKINFNTILELLSNKCIGTLGKKYINEAKFITDYEKLVVELKIVHQLKSWIEEGFQVSHQGFNSMSFLKKFDIENYIIQISEFIQLYNALKTVKQLKNTAKKIDSERYTALTEIINQVPELDAVLIDIEKTIIIEQEIINENVSKVLQQIRKQKSQIQQQIQQNFKRILTHYKAQEFLHETEESIRNERKVLAVLSEKKRSVKGIFVDESSNGSITFIEPEETVHLNNELISCILEEKKEIEKILIHLSNKIRPELDAIQTTQEFLAYFDAQQAKANLAIEYQCTLPEIRKEKVIYLKNFRNLALEYHLRKHKHQIIPNTLQLDEQHRILVISGPNAGGKSVVLKSLGLMQLMLQFGLLLPVDEGSIACIFKQIFSDIGDEQSFENDVSTYSAHLQKMKYFVQKANKDTLILLDEMGVGTDPSLGGAMAEAVLETLHQKNVFGCVTTHFNNLKVYAAQTKGMQSAAMAFDKVALQPKYELQIGQPGSSFTFEIAQKIGMPQNVIQLAKQKTAHNQKALDETLNEVQIEKHYIKGLRKNVQQKETQLNTIVKDYEQLKEDFEKNKKRLTKAYEQRLLDFYNEQSRLLEKQMREWKESLQKKEDYLELRQNIDEQRKTIEQKEISNFQQKKDGIIQVGSKVRLEEGTEIGEVISIDNKKAIVAFGSMRTTFKLHQLVLVEEKANTKKEFRLQKSSKQIIEKSKFESEIDLRGKLVEEAHNALETFMDQSIMYGIHHLKIIHGRGTGKLRTYIHQYLKNYPYIKNYYFEKEEFGGNGVTLVELR